VLWGGNGLSYWLTSCCQKNNKPKKFFGSGASRVLDSGLSPAMITMIVLQKLLWQANTVHPLLL